MYNFDLPYNDCTHITDAIIANLVHYHNSEKPLYFSKIPEDEVDGYIEEWLATLPSYLVEGFYAEAMEGNGFMVDHIFGLYGGESGQEAHVETEKTLMRNHFQKPINHKPCHKSLAEMIEESVNLVIEQGIEA